MIRIDFNRLRFLVIDDNAHMRRILRTLLHGFGTREVYVHYSNGMAHSKLKIPAAKTGTARNMNTVAKLAEWATE